MLHEEMQDFTCPMVVIGSDMVSLYPNLDVTRVCEMMQEAILISPIILENVDYTWHKARYEGEWTTWESGQWGFPQVIITEQEKNDVVATVVRIMTEAMFLRHYYMFGGKVYSNATF